jgi:hypothetical protein
MQLTPCGECHRHVSITEHACPFCGGVIEAPRRASRLGRVSRAVVFGAAAAAAGAGCGKKAKQPGTKTQTTAPADAAPADTASEPVKQDPNNVPMPYGAPPARKRYV